jgi:hypothetical protein
LLFPQSARQLCDSIELNWWAANKLHADGWLSFDPQNAACLNERQEHELRFLGALVTGNLHGPPFCISELLKGLERPFWYDGRRIYYDWGERRWRLLPTSSVHPEPEVTFADWLEALKHDRDIARLEEIKTQVEQILKSLRSTEK